MSQGDEEGNRDTFSFHPKLSISSILPLSSGQYFSPELGLIKYVGLDDEYSKITFFSHANLVYKSNHTLLYKYGVGIFATKISGEGGEITIRNGDDYAIAYRPDESISTYMASLNFSVEYPMPFYSFGLETYLFSPFSSLERSLSYSLTFTYFL